jgi:hypothetical protein
MDERPSYSHLIRAVLAIVLVGALPIILYAGSSDAAATQAYQDALAAVVAFYFGASSEPL